jgi:cytochrome c oxidase subunit 2
MLRAYRRVLWPSLLLIASCGGPQSSLSPAGRSAERIADLFWWMLAGLIVIWLGVMILAIWAARARNDSDRRPQARRLILSGAIIPAVVLCGLLIYGLALLPELTESPPAGTLRVVVHGEQWWWRVRYEPPGGEAFELANEVRLPLGEKVEFLLHSNNVIHSFWIPSLGGKMDMIPGRVNRLVLHPTKTGVYRGVCAEYCGTAHAKMAFQVIVESPDAFRNWLVRQAAPAREPAEAQAAAVPPGDGKESQ